MVQDRWNDTEFAHCKTPLEERVYSSRLLGQDPELVLHGGGNTSVKAEGKDLFGEPEPILYLKASGFDMGQIRQEGFAPLRLSPLQRLNELSSLSDQQMIQAIHSSRLDPQGPSPSVETLLHAFLPDRFIDHTHANAILTLCNQPNGEALLKEALGPRVAISPYFMPGFGLAKATLEAFIKSDDLEGIVLMRHGLVTFGNTAKEVYQQMISLVQRAEAYIQSHSKKATVKVPAPQSPETSRWWLQAIRKALLKRDFPCTLKLDTSPKALTFVSSTNLEKTSQQGPVTPDHVIRTKMLPLLIPPESVAKQDEASLEAALDRYTQQYENYVRQHSEARGITVEPCDPLPRIVLLPQLGILAIGETHQAAQVACDIYSCAVSIITDAEGMGGYQAHSSDHFFDIEYWPPQRAKLKQAPAKKPLTGKTAVVTGGANGIGKAITEEFLRQGANVFIFDISEAHFKKNEAQFQASTKNGNIFRFLQTDVGNRAQVTQNVGTVIDEVGGLDIVVINAGIFPPSATLENITEENWNRSIHVNLSGSLHVVGESVKWLKKQANGGDLLFVASKNVPAPGPQAGTYSIAKAGQTQLARIAALEAGPFGVRVNMLHPHLIFDTDLWTEELIAKRAKAYGMTPDEYKRNNLLKTELSSHDVAKAAFALVSGYFSKTTGAQIPLDGGSDRTL